MGAGGSIQLTLYRDMSEPNMVEKVGGRGHIPSPKILGLESHSGFPFGSGGDLHIKRLLSGKPIQTDCQGAGQMATKHVELPFVKPKVQKSVFRAQNQILSKIDDSIVSYAKK